MSEGQPGGRTPDGRPWALVTGSAKRLGRAIATELAERGWNLVLHYKSSPDEAEAAAASLIARGARALTIHADLLDPDAASYLIPHAAREAGAPILALINSASVFEWDDAETLSADMLNMHFAVNAAAPMLATRALAQNLPAGETAAVVNLLDFKLTNPTPDHLSYTISKYALAGATQALARALAPRVRVNAVAPGFVLPAPGQADEDYTRLHADNPLEYGVTPEDVAGAVAYLIAASGITGQTITIDSGLRFRGLPRDLSFL